MNKSLNAPLPVALSILLIIGLNLTVIAQDSLQSDNASQETVEMEEDYYRQRMQYLESYRHSKAMPVQDDVGESWRAMPPIVNPSNPALSAHRWRVGTILDFGIGIEQGETDDFDRDIDKLVDDFDDLETQAREWEGYDWEDEWEQANNLLEFLDGVERSVDELQEFLIDLDDFIGDSNKFVADISEDAYVKVGAKASVPFLPISIRSGMLDGTFTFSAGALAEVRTAIESTGDAFAPLPESLMNDVRSDDGIGLYDADRFRFVEGTEDEPPGIFYRELDDQGNVIEVHEIAIEPTDEAGIAIQGGVVTHAGLGFSRTLFQHAGRRLNVGANLNYYNVSLVRAGVLLDYDDDMEDTVEDEFDNRKTTTGLGLDLGLMYSANRYTFGGVIRNINEPSFDYPDTSDSLFFQANPQARRGGDEWVMERQYTVQGALHTIDRSLILSTSLDLNSVLDTT